MRAILQKIDSFRLEKWIFEECPRLFKISENGDVLVCDNKIILIYDRSGALKTRYEHDSLVYTSRFSGEDHLLFTVEGKNIYELDTKDLSTKIVLPKTNWFKQMKSGKYLSNDERGLCVLDRNLVELFRWKGNTIRYMQESIEGVYHVVIFRRGLFYHGTKSDVFGGTLDTRLSKSKTEYDEKDFRKLMDFGMHYDWFMFTYADQKQWIYVVRELTRDSLRSWDLELDELKVWKGEVMVNQDFYYLAPSNRFVLSIIPAGIRCRLGELATKTRVMLYDSEANLLEQVLLKGDQLVRLDRKRKNILTLDSSGLMSVYRVCARFAYFFFIIIIIFFFHFNK